MVWCVSVGGSTKGSEAGIVDEQDALKKLVCYTVILSIHLQIVLQNRREQEAKIINARLDQVLPAMNKPWLEMEEIIALISPVQSARRVPVAICEMNALSILLQGYDRYASTIWVG